MSKNYMDPNEKIWLAKKLEERKARKEAEAALRPKAETPVPAAGHAEEAAFRRGLLGRVDLYKSLDKDDRRRFLTDLFFDNFMYIFIVLAVILITIKVPAFLSLSSIVNIISLSAAKLPIALGIAGVLLLQLIFVGLNFLSVDQNMIYVIKGIIILLACAIDMRKYLVKR